MYGDLPAAAVSITVIGIENGSGGGNHAARGADQRYLQVGPAQNSRPFDRPEVHAQRGRSLRRQAGRAAGPEGGAGGV